MYNIIGIYRKAIIRQKRSICNTSQNQIHNYTKILLQLSKSCLLSCLSCCAFFALRRFNDNQIHFLFSSKQKELAFYSRLTRKTYYRTHTFMKRESQRKSREQLYWLKDSLMSFFFLSYATCWLAEGNILLQMKNPQSRSSVIFPVGKQIQMNVVVIG